MRCHPLTSVLHACYTVSESKRVGLELFVAPHVLRLASCMRSGSASSHQGVLQFTTCRPSILIQTSIVYLLHLDLAGDSRSDS